MYIYIYYLLLYITWLYIIYCYILYYYILYIMLLYIIYYIIILLYFYMFTVLFCCITIFYYYIFYYVHVLLYFYCIRLYIVLYIIVQIILYDITVNIYILYYIVLYYNYIIFIHILLPSSSSYLISILCLLCARTLPSCWRHVSAFFVSGRHRGWERHPASSQAMSCCLLRFAEHVIRTIVPFAVAILPAETDWNLLDKSTRILEALQKPFRSRVEALWKPWKLWRIFDGSLLHCSILWKVVFLLRSQDKKRNDAERRGTTESLWHWDIS